MENLEVLIAHDYQCPWCYLSFFQAQKLKQEFPQIAQNWQSYELLPDAITSDQIARPEPSKRFMSLAESDKLPMPKSWPVVTNSHHALEGSEYIKENNPEFFDSYNEKIYRGFWEDGKDISDLQVLGDVAQQIGINKEEFIKAINAKKYDKNITPFKEVTYASGITHVTTFRFMGEQCAEASYRTIREMAMRYLVWYENKR